MANTIKNVAYVNGVCSTEVEAIVGENVIVQKFQNSSSGVINVVPGDTIHYRINVQNPNDFEIKNKLFEDNLDDQIEYVVGTFKESGIVVEPTIDGSKISYNIESIEANGAMMLEFDVVVL